MSFIGSAITGALGSVTKDAVVGLAKSGLETITKEKNILVTSKEPIPQILTDKELKKKVCGSEKIVGISEQELIKELNELKREKYNEMNKRKSNLGRILDRIE